MSAMDFQELISRFGLALGIGLLFGLERGWRMRGEPPGGRTAGIRTFAISGVLGGVVGATAQTIDGVGSGIVLGLGIAAFSAGLAMFCLEENRAQKDYSATTWVAAILTFALGAYAMSWRHASRRGTGGRCELDFSATRAAPRLGRKTNVAGAAVGTRASRDDVYRTTHCARRPHWTLRRRQSARGLAHCHRARRRVVRGLCSGKILRRQPRCSACGRGRRIGVIDRCHYRQCAARGIAGRFATHPRSWSGDGKRSHVPASLCNRSCSQRDPARFCGAATARGCCRGGGQRFDCGVLAPPGRIGAQAFKFRNPFAFWTVIGFAVFLGAVIVVGRLVGEWLGGVGAIIGAAVVGLADVDAITVSVAGLTPSRSAFKTRRSLF